jgi:hypothetical protein
MATINHCPKPKPQYPMESCNPIGECIGMVPRYLTKSSTNLIQNNKKHNWHEPKLEAWRTYI